MSKLNFLFRVKNYLNCLNQQIQNNKNVNHNQGLEHEHNMNTNKPKIIMP